jgi:hypothetical protein
MQSIAVKEAGSQNGNGHFQYSMKSSLLRPPNPQAPRPGQDKKTGDPGNESPPYPNLSGSGEGPQQGKELSRDYLGASLSSPYRSEIGLVSAAGFKSMKSCCLFHPRASRMD